MRAELISPTPVSLGRGKAGHEMVKADPADRVDLRVKEDLRSLDAVGNRPVEIRGHQVKEILRRPQYGSRPVVDVEE